MKLNLFLLSASAMVNAAIGADSVNLGTAGDYAILAKTGITTVPASVITGDIAVSPIAATAITGFSLVADSTNKFSTATQVIGQVKAATYTSPTPSILTTAVSDMETAYTDASSPCTNDARNLRGTSGVRNLDGGNLCGLTETLGDLSDLTLTKGVYTFTKDVTINKDVTFSGSSTDVFIIQTTGNVIQAFNTEVKLKGGALAKNIFWQVAGHVDVAKEAHMEGVLLVKTSATFKTGSSLNGRILAQTAVVLQQATITAPTN